MVCRAESDGFFVLAQGVTESILPPVSGRIFTGVAQLIPRVPRILKIEDNFASGDGFPEGGEKEGAECGGGEINEIEVFTKEDACAGLQEGKHAAVIELAEPEFAAGCLGPGGYPEYAEIRGNGLKELRVIDSVTGFRGGREDGRIPAAFAKIGEGSPDPVQIGGVFWGESGANDE